jgi:hypothetical protein
MTQCGTGRDFRKEASPPVPPSSSTLQSWFTFLCEGSQRWTVEFVAPQREAGGLCLVTLNGPGDDSAEEAIAQAVYAASVGG